MWTLTKATKNSRNDQVWTTWYQSIDGHGGNLAIETSGSYTNGSGNNANYNPYLSITKAHGVGVRPVVYMKANVPVTKGTGTKKDPFILVSENKSVNKLNQSTIGEYIYLDEENNHYTTSSELVVNGISYTYNKNKVRYRIIDLLSDGSIKVERADLLRSLPSTIAINSGIYVPYYYKGNADSTGCGSVNGTWYYGGCTNHNYFKPEEGTGEFNYKNSMNIAYYLNNASNSFYDWFSDTTKSYILKTNWQLPVVAHATDYSVRMDRSKDIVGQSSYQNNNYDGEIEAYVGLPSYGERYTGNDLNIGYWYINRWPGATSTVGFIYASGYVSGYHAGSDWLGVRPVLVLDSHLNITSGSGTSDNPYVISK